MLPINTPLPKFSTSDQRGEIVTNSSLAGHWTVLYFYPKDETPGCTTQACSFRDSYMVITELHAEIYGVSGDSAASHRKFIENQHLPFSLLVDADHQLAKSLDVWVEKSMYGKKYMGLERSTYIINPMGMIVGAYQKVKPENHAAFIADELRKLQEIK